MTTSDGTAGARILGDVRVLDLSLASVAARAASILGDYGADVVKLVAEDPRTTPDDALPDWLVDNRSKRLAFGDTMDEATRHEVRRLAETADLVIADTLEQLRGYGLDPEQLGARRVVLTTPPFTSEATPWYGEGESNALLDAFSGVSRYQGSYHGGPVSSVYPYLLQIQSVWAATTAVAALTALRNSGVGQLATATGFHAAMIFADIMFSRPIGEPDPYRAVGAGGSNPMYTRYQGSDGEWVFVGGLGPKFSNAVLDVIGLRDLLDDPRIGGTLNQLWQPENSVWVIEAFAERFAQRPAAEWIEALEAADIPCTLLNRREDWLRSEQMQEMRQALKLDDPVLGAVTMTGAIIDSVTTPATITQPDAGAPIADIQWYATPAVPSAPRPIAAGADGPLAGYRAAVLGSYVAGPFVGRLLVELGVDAIKVEPPVGDPWRIQGFGMNRGYRGIVVDLTQDAGRDALVRVLDGCDVVVDNFRLGVLERRGLSHDHLVKTRPEAVTVSVTAYGERGPLSHKPGYDPVLQAASGMMYAQGGDAEPVAWSLPPNDCTTAVIGALAAVLGIYRQTMTGHGLHLSTALGTTAIFLQAPDLIDYPGRPAGRSGGEDYAGISAADRYYQVSDGYIRIQAEALDAGRLAAAGLDIDPAALETDAVAEMSRVLAPLDRAEAVRRLTEAGIPAVPSRLISEVSVDPALHASAQLIEFTSLSGERFTATGHFAEFSATPVTTEFHAPGLGEHSTELLIESGFDDDRVTELVATGAVIQGEPMVVTYMPPYR